MKRTFAALNPQEALHVAIFIEERNFEIYQRFAEMFTEFRDRESLEIASVFREMAIEEQRHSSMLQARYTERYGNAACAITEDNLTELIEVPRLEDGDVFAAVRSGDQSEGRRRALHVAIAAEGSAQTFYANLMDKTTPGPLRLIYQELAQMEGDHISLLRSKLGESTASN